MYSEYYTTRENKETLELKDGMPMEFVLSVKRLCSGEVKEYHYNETFKSCEIMGGMINENKKSFNGCHNDSRFFMLKCSYIKS